MFLELTQPAYVRRPDQATQFSPEPPGRPQTETYDDPPSSPRPGAASNDNQHGEPRPLTDGDSPGEPDTCPDMNKPGRVHDTDVGHQTLIAHERTAGQFCLPGVAEPVVKWPLLAKPEWTAAGEIPGVPPSSRLGNIISPDIAASRQHSHEQARGSALRDQPFSDYNSVPQAAAVPFSPTPSISAAYIP